MIMETNVTTEMVRVTPQMAEAMLGTNLYNRNLRENHVIRLAGAMERGEWMYNGEAIKFADDGTLLDGQHRLHAIVLSGVTIEMLVVRGLDKATAETMDAGEKKNLGDFLKMHGETMATQLASSLSWLFKIRSGTMKRNSTRFNPTRQQALALLEENPNIRDCVKVGARVNRAVKVPTSLYAALHHEFLQADEEDAEEFLRLILTGDGLGQGHPVFTLRRVLLNAATSPQQTYSNVKAAWIVKAWNAFRDGREVTNLMWRPGGRANEDFPEIQ